MLGALALLLAGLTPLLATPANAAPPAPYPLGVANAASPSGYAPPATSALPGYTQNYVQDFTANSIPAEWAVYSGLPGGDPGGQFGPAHVNVAAGLMVISTYRDPAYNNEWVTGGTCLCGNNLAQLYGAWFVRSRVTGAGPTSVELLWPDTNIWPPEIDFNESGGATTSETATTHFGANNSIVQSSLTIDLTKWHTWGVIWSPTSIIYTVDGRYWASVTNPAEIPKVSMHLSIQSQTWCGASPAWACPTSNQQTLVDWVAEYAPTSPTATLPVPPGTPVLHARYISSNQAWVSWSDTGTLSSLSASLYTNATCTSLVRATRLPTTLDKISGSKIHFSALPSGAPAPRSFSSRYVYYARITSVVGPSGTGPPSACVRLGRG
jgi:hypothetical protein